MAKDKMAAMREKLAEIRKILEGNLRVGQLSQASERKVLTLVVEVLDEMPAPVAPAGSPPDPPTVPEARASKVRT